MSTMTLTLGRTLEAIRHERQDWSGTTPAPARLSSHRSLMFALWLFIGTVSAVDTHLTLHYREVMADVEENPLGKLLIHLDGRNVTLFVSCKVTGTLVVLAVLAWIGLYARRNFAYAVLTPVALAQMTLLWYLFS